MSIFSERINKLKSGGVNNEAVSSPLLIRQRVQQISLNKIEKESNCGNREALLASIVGAEIIAPGVILYTEKIAEDHYHGRFLMQEIFSSQKHLLGIDDTVDIENLLFFDTETTGLSGGSGTIAFMLGFARFEQGALVIRQYFISRFSAEKEALQHAAQWFNQHTVLVSYNGKSFDAPLLATRYQLSQLTNPLSTLPHLDLLFPVRSAFAKSWDNCRLITVEQQLFAIERQDDIPGEEIPSAWFQFVRHGHMGLMPKIFTHNRLDILTLVALYAQMPAVFTDPLRYAADAGAVARYLIRNDFESEAFSILQANRYVLNDHALRELALLHKKRGDMHESVRIWQLLSNKCCVESMVNLSKYYEHEVKDYHSALEMVEKLLKHDHANINHLKRQLRLETKLLKYAMSA